MSELKASLNDTGVQINKNCEITLDISGPSVSSETCTNNAKASIEYGATSSKTINWDGNVSLS